jgi:predicted aldo/keto reductase-like oxidoreductase
MADTLPRLATLGPDLPRVCRLGLATRGNSRLRIDDVAYAIDRGINYLNWCGHPDGLSRTIARLDRDRSRVAVAVQFQARTAGAAADELSQLLEHLRSPYVDVLTLYYVESGKEWDELSAPGGVLDYLEGQQQRGTVRLVGLTSHQRKLAAAWAGTGRLDLLMVRYNAAHRGAEQDVFPLTGQMNMPVVTFTGLRWKALLESTPDDPRGFRPPPAAECYRFCLAHPGVTVALAAPGNRQELNHTVTLLDDWRLPAPPEIEALRAHGDRVRKHAGVFW